MLVPDLVAYTRGIDRKVSELQLSTSFLGLVISVSYCLWGPAKNPSLWARLMDLGKGVTSQNVMWHDEDNFFKEKIQKVAVKYSILIERNISLPSNNLSKTIFSQSPQQQCLFCQEQLCFLAVLPASIFLIMLPAAMSLNSVTRTTVSFNNVTSSNVFLQCHNSVFNIVTSNSHEKQCLLTVSLTATIFFSSVTATIFLNIVISNHVF